MWEERPLIDNSMTAQWCVHIYLGIVDNGIVMCVIDQGNNTNLNDCKHWCEMSN